MSEMGQFRVANTTAKIRTVDMPVLDKVFAMEDGWVLNFSN